jgi:hypothetical protein
MGIWVPSLIRGCRNVALVLLLLGCGASVTGSVGADATAADLGADAVISAEDVPRNDTSREAAVDPAVPGRECMVAADCPRFSGSLACEVGYCVGRSGGREWRLCESGRYVSVLDDPAHCGRCNNPCGILETCAGRVCVPCVDGTGRCEVSVNRCGINLRADPSHCGACGRRCSDEERCVVGTCTPCPTGMGRCGATNCATALSTNRLHCGACNRRCADDEVCTAGVCVRCPEGSDRCGTSMCFDLQSDARHCGGCFQACPDGSPCVGGSASAALRARAAAAGACAGTSRRTP